MNAPADCFAQPGRLSLPVRALMRLPWGVKRRILAHPNAWREQRHRVLSAAKAGEWFGTISSEPGTGGDVMATRATAAPDEEGRWRVSGDKHMGSGLGVTSYMITIAVPEGEESPDIFLLDTRELPWDGSQGATLVREWDGHGVKSAMSNE